mmetsp:Transcript_19649/g.49250  ORF Transcript_19649/g.49250 Transcript_19649/m.49250 type:complete len:241 (-) Transcript_19649:72-794(-)
MASTFFPSTWQLSDLSRLPTPRPPTSWLPIEDPRVSRQPPHLCLMTSPVTPDGFVRPLCSRLPALDKVGLVILFRFPKLSCALHLGHDPLDNGLLVPGLLLESLCLLAVAVRIYPRAVLGAPIVPLPVELRSVVDLKEDAAEVPERDLSGVEGHLDSLCVPRLARAHLLVGGRLLLAGRVPHFGGENAGQALKGELYTPEASRRERGLAFLPRGGREGVDPRQHSTLEGTGPLSHGCPHS